MKISHVKMLGAEEQRILEVEEAALLNILTEQARLAPALSDLAASITHFSAFVANVPSHDLSSPTMAPYKFSDMARQAVAIQDNEVRVTVDRWNAALDEVLKQVQQATPKDWKPKVIDGFDQDYIKSNILVNSLIQGLGQNYASASLWLTELEKNQFMFNSYKERHGDHLKTCVDAFQDSKDLASCILAYNTMINKWDKCKQASERRQHMKDLNKIYVRNSGKVTRCRKPFPAECLLPSGTSRSGETQYKISPEQIREDNR